MLKLAKLYEDELKLNFAKVTLDKRFMFYYGSSYSSEYKSTDSTWEEIEFASIDSDGKVIGYLSFSINRESRRAYGVHIINFRTFDNKKYAITFGKDVFQFFDDIFNKYNFRKLEYAVVVGNPIEKTYDKLTKKYGGRIVGVYEKDTILLDGNLYDYKVYEIMKENFKK